MALPAPDSSPTPLENVRTLSQVPTLASAEFDEGCQLWLAWLCKLLLADALKLYRVYQGDGKGRLDLIAFWPGKYISSRAGIDKMVLRAATSRSVVRAKSGAYQEHSVVCVPDTTCSVQSATRCVVVIERSESSTLDLNTQSRLVSWAFLALERYTAKPVATTGGATLLPMIIAQLDRQETLNDAFARLMQQMRDVTGCERCIMVKLSLRRQRVRGAKLLAVSGQARVDSRLSGPHALAQSVEAMYHGHAQPLLSRCEPSVPAYAFDRTSSLEAAQFCTRLTLPVGNGTDWFAVSIERADDQPFSESEQVELSQELNAAVQVLLLQDSSNSGITSAIKRRLHLCRQWMLVSVPRSVATLCVVGMVLLLLLYPVERRITAALSVEAAEQHVLIAPVDGFVRSVQVKAGDTVGESQVLGSLDDLDVQLQWQQRQSELKQNQQAYAKALATRNRVEVTRLKEEALLIQAELSQLQTQQERLVLKAPVAGVVLSDSLDDFLGAAVTAGDSLFSIGSSTSHRLVLNVSEYDVESVKLGQQVGIRLSADPSSVLAATVTAIMPLATVVNGVNSVQVHATLLQDALLRPGMEGLGKVLVGRQGRLSQWLTRAGSRLTWLAWKAGVIR